MRTLKMENSTHIQAESSSNFQRFNASLTKSYSNFLKYLSSNFNKKKTTCKILLLVPTALKNVILTNANNLPFTHSSLINSNLNTQFSSHPREYCVRGFTRSFSALLHSTSIFIHHFPLHYFSPKSNLYGDIVN